MTVSDRTAPGVSVEDGLDGTGLWWEILLRYDLGVIWERTSGGIETPRNVGDV